MVSRSRAALSPFVPPARSQRRLAARVAIAGTLSILLGILATACGSEGRGNDACEAIETARCRRAPACGIDLPGPFANGADNVDNCIAYYKDQCLHGLASGESPRGSTIDGCVAAINSDCAAVKAPETATACAFLLVPDAGSDTGTTTDGGSDTGSDAGTDATSDATVDAAK
jgi:hypothetical protein